MEEYYQGLMVSFLLASTPLTAIIIITTTAITIIMVAFDHGSLFALGAILA